MHELILGGQRSGKSRCAEGRAAAWLSRPGHQAALIATAVAGDVEMRARIERHRADRSRALPALQTIEASHELAAMLRSEGRAQRLLIVDCLSLWLTNLLMPIGEGPLDDEALTEQRTELCDAVSNACGPVVLVSNEIGMGVIAMTSQARRFVDELGRLHQAVAAVCDSVTLMVAGIELPVKRASR